MKSWKTTLFGAIGVAAGCVVAADFGPMATKVAGCIASIGTALGLFFARDNNVTSEMVNAGKPKPAVDDGNIAGKVGIWLLFWAGLALLITGCAGSLDRQVFRLESAAVGTADGAMQGYALYYRAATNNPAAFNRTLESLTLEREQAKALASQVGAAAEMVETLRLSYKTNAAVEPALRASVATLNANMLGIVTYITNIIHIKPTN